MNRPPASYLNSSVMGNYLLNWIDNFDEMFGRNFRLPIKDNS